MKYLLLLVIFYSSSSIFAFDVEQYIDSLGLKFYSNDPVQWSDVTTRGNPPHLILADTVYRDSYVSKKIIRNDDTLWITDTTYNTIVCKRVVDQIDGQYGVLALIHRYFNIRKDEPDSVKIYTIEEVVDTTQIIEENFRH